MVHAGLPQHVLAAHPLKSGKNILNGIVERMPHMERTGHIRWWNDDAIGCRPALQAVRLAARKCARLFPLTIDPRLDLGGLIFFFKHFRMN
ncbi:hypothetical protein MnTg02_01510 [bacterium MnTg02]|nr:hypothetical protein MnTg02_01510 [bacterium MnTg02]